MCDLCRKKININSLRCYECKDSLMSFKFNTNIEFNDYSGGILLSVFDSVAQKVFGIPAAKMKELQTDQDQFKKFVDNIVFRPYSVGIEIKSDRFILRTF